jgi:hypothetical protein
MRFDLNPKAADDAVADLCRAIEIARDQEAHSYEVRAATSLRRILPETQGSIRPQDMLRDAVERFPKATHWDELETARRLLDS